MEACNVGVVNMSFHDDALIATPGFGYLIPGSEGEPVLGVSFDSCIFPEQRPRSAADATIEGTTEGTIEGTTEGTIEGEREEKRKGKGTVVCVMIGGVNCPEVTAMTEVELLDMAKASLSKHLDIDRAVIETELNTHCSGVVHDCIPQYYVGHSDAVQALEVLLKADMPELTVLGTPFYGVGLADSVSQAKKIATAFSPC
jgi:oxygen-dependent protoporphyrinogen oxidase